LFSHQPWPGESANRTARAIPNPREWFVRRRGAFYFSPRAASRLSVRLVSVVTALRSDSSVPQDGSLVLFLSVHLLATLPVSPPVTGGEFFGHAIRANPRAPSCPFVSQAPLCPYVFRGRTERRSRPPRHRQVLFQGKVLSFLAFWLFRPRPERRLDRPPPPPQNRRATPVSRRTQARNKCCVIQTGAGKQKVSMGGHAVCAFETRWRAEKKCHRGAVESICKHIGACALTTRHVPYAHEHQRPASCAPGEHRASRRAGDAGVTRT
jgi:hypothetical protein